MVPLRANPVLDDSVTGYRIIVKFVDSFFLRVSVAKNRHWPQRHGDTEKKRREREQRTDGIFSRLVTH